MFKIDKEKTIIKNCQDLQKLKDNLTNHIYNKDELLDIKDEVKELEEAINNKNIENIKEELGDVIFAVCRLANKYNIDLEKSFKKSTKKFCKRINFIQEKTDLKNIRGYALKELWRKAKNFYKKKDTENEKNI